MRLIRSGLPDRGNGLLRPLGGGGSPDGKERDLITNPSNKRRTAADVVARSPQSTHVRLMILVLSAVLLVVLGGASHFASPQAAAEWPATPVEQDNSFKAEFVVTQTITPDPTCGGLHVRATGTGPATHLGQRTRASFDECANFVVEPGRVHVYGSGVLASPDGDELHLTLNKAGKLPDLAGNVHVAGNYTITGGTGRFDRATGSGTTTTDTNVTSTLATVKLTGTLARP